MVPSGRSALVYTTIVWYITTRKMSAALALSSSGSRSLCAAASGAGADSASRAPPSYSSSQLVGLLPSTRSTGSPDAPQSRWPAAPAPTGPARPAADARTGLAEPAAGAAASPLHEGACEGSSGAASAGRPARPSPSAAITCG
eukprot:scaffold23111_cov117-Isochrysis_galbana.AAC.5